MPLPASYGWILLLPFTVAVAARRDWDLISSQSNRGHCTELATHHAAVTVGSLAEDVAVVQVLQLCAGLPSKCTPEAESQYIRTVMDAASTALDLPVVVELDFDNSFVVTLEDGGGEQAAVRLSPNMHPLLACAIGCQTLFNVEEGSTAIVDTPECQKSQLCEGLEAYVGGRDDWCINHRWEMWQETPHSPSNSLWEGGPGGWYVTAEVSEGSGEMELLVVPPLRSSQLMVWSLNGAGWRLSGMPSVVGAPEGEEHHLMVQVLDSAGYTLSNPMGVKIKVVRDAPSEELSAL